MKSIWKRQAIVLGAAVLTAGMWMGPQQDADAGYLTDTWGTVVRNNYGECWQGIWPNPDHAPGCEGVMTFVLSADNFDFDSAVLKPQMKRELDGIASKIKGASVSSVTVTGHTDSIGSDAYNQDLSERRAKSAARYLRGKGIKGIKTRGMGEKKPVASNATDAGRAKNRRVVIEAK
jgi:outer membrane protein OmpA-like peptidoglycan-associated protein